MKYLLVILALLGCTPDPTTDVAHVPAPLPDPPKQALQEYALKVMEVCGTKVSQVRQNAIATTIETVVPWYIKDRADQEMFVMLLCIESKFDNRAKSPVGAIGLAQLMPKYAQNFANLCNLGKLENGDVEDPTINITLGACFFSSLRKELKSSILAVAAYNAGPASSSVRNLSMLGNPVAETASYVAKAEMLREKMNDKQSADKGAVSHVERQGVPNQRGAGEEPGGTPAQGKQPAN